MKITPQKIVRILLVVAILGAGFGIRQYLVSTKPEAKNKALEDQGELVVARHVKAGDYPIHVQAQGRIIAARELNLQAEVTGRIRWMNENLMPGGLIAKNATILRIDPRDYTLAAQQQKAALERSALAVKVEESRKAIAEKEIELLKKGTASALARRDPQLNSARNGLKASESALDRANLMIARTVIRAPFNAVVLTKNSEVGQLVSPAAPLGRLVGTDHFWVQISIPMDRLAWIKIPGVNAAKDNGAAVRIRQDVGAGSIVRQGRVLRLAGDLDPAGQMARLIVEIDDPMGLQDQTREVEGNSSALPLLLGAFVDVNIDAGTLKGVVELDRRALHPGSLVYLVSKERTLQSQQVQELWGEEKTVYIKGIPASAEVITSRVPLAINGLKLRIQAAVTPQDTADAKGPGDTAKNPAPAKASPSTTDAKATSATQADNKAS